MCFFRSEWLGVTQLLSLIQELIPGADWLTMVMWLLQETNRLVDDRLGAKRFFSLVVAHQVIISCLPSSCSVILKHFGELCRRRRLVSAGLRYYLAETLRNVHGVSSKWCWWD